MYAGTFHHLEGTIVLSSELEIRDIAVPVNWSWENINGCSDIIEVDTDDFENVTGGPNGLAGRKLPPIDIPSSFKPAPTGHMRYVSLK